MAVDQWNGNGNWQSNSSDWSTGAPPASNATAEIETGSSTLTGSGGSVQSIVVDTNTSFYTYETTLATVLGVNNAGNLAIDNSGGGSTATFGGVLTNSGTADIGNTNLSASTTVTAAGLVNTGTLVLQGNTASGTTDQATLDITGSTSSVVTGTLRVLGDADLELTTGITAVGYGGFFQIDGTEARVSLGAGMASNAISELAVNDGTVNFDGNCSLGAGGTTVVTTTAFDNANTLWVDYYGGDGATNVTFGGVLTNSATAIIGNTSLGNATSGVVTTTVTAKGLVNTGSLILQGNTASGTENQATLDITGVTSATVTGSIRVLGDADLELKTGITTVAYGGFFQIDGAEARVSLGAGTTSNALSKLATNDGTLNFDGNCSLGAGGTTVTTTTALDNAGTLWVDYYGGDGATNVTFGGVLTNAGTAIIGNTSLGNAVSGVVTTTVTAKGLVNTGSLELQGNVASGTENQATLDITGTTSATVTGSIRVLGDSDLELTTGITAVGYGGFFQIDGAEARVSLGAGTTSNALSKLATNDGTLNFDGNCTLGAGGTTVTTTTALDNAGTLWVDYYGGDGATNVTFGGVLTNAGTAIIGNTSLGNAASGVVGTTVTAKGLVNTGSLYVEGNVASGSTDQATLNVTGAAPSTLGGTVSVRGDADIEFGSGGITTIQDGAFFELDGAAARVSIGSGTVNNALSKLAVNNGTIVLRGNSGYGAGGVTVMTGTSFTNSGTLDVDYYGGDGGSSLTFGGKFTNTGTATIGDTSLGNSAPQSVLTTVTATGLVNTGSLYVEGNTASGTADETILDISGAAPSTLAGTVKVWGDADIEFGSGGITSIQNGAFFELDGSAARVSIGSGTANNALSKLGVNNGTILLRGNSNYGGGSVTLTTTVSFTNNGTLDVDYYGSDGGSNLTFGRTFNNIGTAFIGNNNSSASTTVAAAGLSNSGNLTLNGAGSNITELNLDGSATNTGNLDIGQSSELLIDGTFTNTGTADIGNIYYTSNCYSALVTATGLTNSGNLILAGDAADLAELDIDGSATNTGNLTIDASSELLITGAPYVQDAGTTTVSGGTLSASAVKIYGGLLDFKSALTSGDGTGTIYVYSGGTIEFDASVDSSHKVSFENTSGTLDLTEPAAFSGKINGFSGSDVIDVANTAVTGFSYSGNASAGTLTLTGASGTIGSLAFSGSYSTSNFSTVSDGHGGTDILYDPTSAMADVAAEAPAAVKTLSYAGSDQEVTLGGTAGVDILDIGNALRINIASSTQTDTISGFGTNDANAVLDLKNGAGGYTSVAEIAKALHSDGNGGTMLLLGATGSIDFLGTKPSQLHASNFAVG